MLPVGSIFKSGVACAVVVGPGIPNILVEGSPISVVGDKVAPHGAPPHTSSVVISGVPNILAAGKPITVVSSTTSCGHPITFGSPTVVAGL